MSFRSWARSGGIAALAMAIWSGRGRAAPPASSLAAPLAAGRGRLLATQPGGTVRGRTKAKKSVTLADGQEVTFIDDDAGVGNPGKSGATVRVNGTTMVVPNTTVITEERLNRSPAASLKQDWAIFSTIEECGDVCHGASVLLGPGVRVRLGGDSDVVGPGGILWRPDGRQVVVDGDEPATASLPDGRVRKLGDYGTPAYSPDGRLFVRGERSRSRDNVFEALPDGKLRWITGWPGRPPEDPIDPDDPYSPPENPSVTPVSFLADGTLVADFNRPGPKRTQVQLPRAQIGTRPDDLRAEVIFRAALRVADEKVPPAEAAKVARALVGQTAAPWTRELASAVNSRGYDLYQQGGTDAALPLFETAADLDPTYGMPRYNAARVWASRGDAPAAIRWLQQLKAMGPSQRARLVQTRKDAAFKKLWDAPGYVALGISSGATGPSAK